MTARKNAIWTAEELETLRALREQNTTVPVIASQLRRPVSAVYAQARKIGTRVMVRNVWDETEDARLAELVKGGLTDKEIAEQLERSVSSVRWRMQMLDLLRDRSAHLVKRMKQGRAERKAATPAAERVSKPKKPVAKKAPTAPAIDFARLRELAQTHTRAQAAEVLGLTMSQINYALRDEKIAFLDPRELIAQRDHARVLELFGESVAPAQIAAEIDRPVAWVNKALAKAGMREVRKRSKNEGCDVDAVKEMAKTHTITEVAKLSRRDPRTLRKLSEEHGFEFLKAVREKATPIRKSAGLAMTRLTSRAAARAAPVAQRNQGPRAPKLSRAAMARRLMLIRDIAERMRAEGRLPA